jgi:hypothetical protein
MTCDCWDYHENGKTVRHFLLVKTLSLEIILCDLRLQHRTPQSLLSWSPRDGRGLTTSWLCIFPQLLSEAKGRLLVPQQLVSLFLSKSTQMTNTPSPQLGLLREGSRPFSDHSAEAALLKTGPESEGTLGHQLTGSNNTHFLHSRHLGTDYLHSDQPAEVVTTSQLSQLQDSSARKCHPGETHV